MGITDYNKKKQLDVDSVSGTPTVDKAQPLIVGGETIVQEVDGWEDGDLSSNPQWTELFSQSSIDNTIQSSVVKNGSNALEVSVSSGTSSIETLAHDRGGGSVSDGDKYSTWFRVNGNQIFEYGLGSGSGQFSSGNDFVSASVDSQNRVNLSSETEINSNFTTISNDEWFRLEIELNPSQSEAVLRIYDTDNSFIAEDTVSTNGASAYQYVKIQAGGLNSNNNVDAYFDDVSYSSNSTSSLKDDSKTGNGDIVIDFSNVSDAQDIAVYDQNGNLLDYEIEDLDTTNETGVLWAYNDWVRDGTTQAQVAYGNNSANTDRQNVSGTWSNTGQKTYQVQHLEEDSPPFLDSTSNDRDSTSTTGTTKVNAEFDGGRQGDGTDDKIIYSDEAPAEQSITAVFYLNAQDYSEDAGIIVIEDAGGAVHTPGFYINRFNPGGISFRGFDGSSQHKADIPSNDVSTGTTYQIAGRYDSGNTIEIVQDGDVVESSSTRVLNFGPDISYLGFKAGGGAFFTDGWLDAVRLYTDLKSDAWLQADFDASPKAGQVFFSQQASVPTTTAVSATVTDSLGFAENTVSKLAFTTSDNLQVTENTAGTLSDTLSDNVQFSEQVIGTIQERLTDQLGFTENTAAALALQVSDQLAFSEQTVADLTLQVLTSDNLQFSESTQAQLIDKLTNQLSFTESTQSAIAESVSDQVGFSEAVSSSLIDLFTDELDLSETTKIQGTAVLTLSDNVAFAENIDSKLEDLQSDNLSFNENVESRLEQVFEDSLNFSEQFEAQLAAVLADQLDFSERAAETVAATLTDSLSFAEKITASELFDLEIKSPTKAVMTTPDRFAVMESVTFKQNDLGDTLKATLKDDNGDINVSNASDVRLIANNREGKNVLNESVTVTNGSAGEVEYSWSSGDFIENAGIYRIEFEVEDGTGEVETVPNDGFVTVEIEEELAE